MIKLNEIGSNVLKKYADNLDRLDDITDQLISLNREAERLQSINETIEFTGKLPVFNSDDIPF